MAAITASMQLYYSVSPLSSSCSTNIPDPRRHVKSIVLSPVGNLAALVDGFGRVMLLDVSSLVIRRMWKGQSITHTDWNKER